MKVVSDHIVSLGFGKYARAEWIAALIPMEEDRGSGCRPDGGFKFNLGVDFRL